MKILTNVQTRHIRDKHNITLCSTNVIKNKNMRKKHKNKLYAPKISQKQLLIRCLLLIYTKWKVWYKLFFSHNLFNEQVNKLCLVASNSILILHTIILQTWDYDGIIIFICCLKSSKSILNTETLTVGFCRLSQYSLSK